MADIDTSVKTLPVPEWSDVESVSFGKQGASEATACRWTDGKYYPVGYQTCVGATPGHPGEVFQCQASGAWVNMHRPCR
jgi:hypothetical protein